MHPVWASTAPTRPRRSATAPRTAASACRYPKPSGSSSTSTSERPSSFSRQLNAEVGQQDDRAGEGDEPGDDQPRVTRLAHRVGERAAEQDQDAHDQPAADDQGRQQDDVSRDSGAVEKLHYDE